jgi:hypothetical protein
MKRSLHETRARFIGTAKRTGKASSEGFEECPVLASAFAYAPR